MFCFVYSKKVNNTTRQVVNSTETSGAAEVLRFATLCSFRISAINKGIHVLLVVALSNLLFMPLMTPL